MLDRWQELIGTGELMEFRQQLGPEIRTWQDDILELVRAQGAGKRTTAGACQ